MKALRIASIVMSGLALIGAALVGTACVTTGNRTHTVSFPTGEHNEEMLVCMNDPEKSEMECISLGLFQAAARQRRGEQDLLKNFDTDL